MAKGQQGFDRNKVQAMVRRRGREATERASKITAERAKENVIKSGRVDTGDMADGFEIEQTGIFEYRIFNKVPYFRYQELGRRGFSAKPGKVLRFKPKGSAIFVFAKKVGPVSPGNFLTDALKALKPRDFLP